MSGGSMGAIIGLGANSTLLIDRPECLVEPFFDCRNVDVGRWHMAALVDSFGGAIRGAKLIRFAAAASLIDRGLMPVPTKRTER